MNWADPKGLIEPAPAGFTFLGGVNDILGTRGSNVHYTQALASYGLFLGLFYILFMLNIFGPIKTKINNVTLMSLIIFSLTFISYNWTLILPLSFIAFINNNYKNTYNYE